MTITPHSSSRQPKHLKSALAMIVAGAMALSGASLASATEAPDTPTADTELVEQSLSNVRTSGEGLLAVAQNPSAGAGTEHSLGAGTVTVPTEAENGLDFSTPSGETITINLPNSGAAGKAELLQDGAVTYPAESSANSVIVSEASVQMLTTIASADAPTRYDYELDLAPGQRIESAGEGLQVIGADGSVQLAAGQAWARDAAGQSIPTRYEVNGSTVTQVVEHNSSSEVTYPVVADPIWLAPWVVRCLIGIGLKGPDIARIASLGTPWAIAGAFGRGALACVFGK